MILSICANEIDDKSFNVWNTISDQTYSESGINLKDNVTQATLFFGKVNGSLEDEVCVDISADFHYLFETGGLTIDFASFGQTLINGYSYWADWMYTIRIEYFYCGEPVTTTTTTSIGGVTTTTTTCPVYTAECTLGFKARITHIIYQQMLQSNWKKELACTCGCDSYSTTLRKWDYLQQMEIAANLCLVNEYLTIMQALYKLTGTTHEFAT